MSLVIGERLIALPDGEIGDRSGQYPSGDRSQWVAGLAGRLATEPSLFDIIDAGTDRRAGFPVDFESTLRLRPRLNRPRLGKALSPWLRHCCAAELARIRTPPISAASLTGLRMQVGLPTGFGIAVSVLSAPRALCYARAFVDSLAREAAKIHRLVGTENALFQIEAPAEVVAAHRMPKPAIGLAADSTLTLREGVSPRFRSVSTSVTETSTRSCGSRPDDSDRLVALRRRASASLAALY